MTNELIANVTDATFESDVLKAEGPVLLDCWAEWCGPCKMLAPVLADLAEGYAGTLKIVKMDVDQNRETPGKLGIRGIPTLLFFNAGELVASKAGAMSKAQLSAFIEGHLVK